MDLVVLVQVHLHGEVVAAVGLDPGALELALLQVVLPVDFVGGPQRQAQALFAFAHRPQVLAVFALTAAMPRDRHAGHRQHQQGDQQRQRMAGRHAQEQGSPRRFHGVVAADRR